MLYLHGFRSSPASHKARVLGTALQERGWGTRYQCPALPASPQAAVALALALIGPTPSPDLTLVGSSLGGFYATWLAEHTGVRAVVINPVVHAARELRHHVGQHRQYHTDAPFDFRPEYVHELEALAVSAITRPERYLLLAATGDEILDWRDMREHYLGARQIIIPGSDHGLSDFANWLPDVLAFAGLAHPAPNL